MTARRIVLDIHPRSVPLSVGQDLVLVLEIVALRLEQDDIDVEIPDLVGGDFANGIRPVGVRRPAAIALRMTRLGGDEGVVAAPTQRLEGAAAGGAGQGAGGAHRASSAAAVVETA